LWDGWKAPCQREIEVIQGDIRDFDSVSKAMKGCDTVFHLAALIGIPYSYISPLHILKLISKARIMFWKGAKAIAILT